MRVKGIVQDLKDFSRTGGEEAWEMADLHAVLESTLNIVRSELKRKARIEINYGDLPKVECVPSRLGQVFINLLVNAGQAIGAEGKVTLSTGVDGSQVWIRVEDTGCGHQRRKPETDLRPVLHHQAGRRRHRARAVGVLRDRDEARRADRRRKRDRARHQVHRAPADPAHAWRGGAGLG